MCSFTIAAILLHSLSLLSLYLELHLSKVKPRGAVVFLRLHWQVRCVRSFVDELKVRWVRFIILFLPLAIRLHWRLGLNLILGLFSSLVSNLRMLKMHGCICKTNLLAVLHLRVHGLRLTDVLHKNTWWLQPWLNLVLTHVHFVEALVENRLAYMTCKALLVLQLNR